MTSVVDARRGLLDGIDECELFTVAIRAGGGHVRLVLTGELDVAGVRELDEIVQLVGRVDLPFTIDCRQLTFIDCAGIGALLRATRSGGTLDGVRGVVARVFDLLDLRDVLHAAVH